MNLHRLISTCLCVYANYNSTTVRYDIHICSAASLSHSHLIARTGIFPFVDFSAESCGFREPVLEIYKEVERK